MGARRDFPVDADYANGRLETFLRRKLGLPRTLALKACRKGWIRISGKRSKPETRLEPGAIVTVTNPALELPGLEGPAKPRAPRPAAAVIAKARASIRFRDADLLVSAKPAGEVVHAGTGHASGWVDALRAVLEDEGAAPDEVVPIGRLDRDTSGLLVCALRRAAVRDLFDALKEARVARTYQALVLGKMRGDRGVIELALEKQDVGGGREQMVADEHEGKASLTRWKLVRRIAGTSLVELEIDTGRTHQIRAHLAAIGHPLLGDPRYGTPASHDLSRRIGLARLFLHAGRLLLDHPKGSTRRFEEPLPRELATPLARLEGRFG